MKAEFKVTKTVDVKYCRVSVHVRYEEEDIPNDFPLREGDMWNATIDVDSATITGWPQGQSGELHMKICDEGCYYLYDSDMNEVAAIIQDYVPNNLLPGEYGDYLHLKINESGRITNWHSKPTFEDFQEEK